MGFLGTELPVGDENAIYQILCCMMGGANSTDLPHSEEIGAEQWTEHVLIGGYAWPSPPNRQKFWGGGEANPAETPHQAPLNGNILPSSY